MRRNPQAQTPDPMAESDTLTQIREATELDLPWNVIVHDDPVNLMGYVFCAKAAITQMRTSGGGVIVNMASVRSMVVGPKCVQYDTTKHAILGLTRSMARDHAADNVRVMAVGPGPIFTDFHEKRAKELGQTDEQYCEKFGADTMMNRPGTPLEVANAVLFLASDEASFMTGTCIFVDGGQTSL